MSLAALLAALALPLAAAAPAGQPTPHPPRGGLTPGLLATTRAAD